MKKRRPQKKPTSLILILGVCLLLAGIVLPALNVPLTSSLHPQDWKLLRALSAVIIVIGLIRTAILRHRAVVVKRAKDEAGLLGEQLAASELGKLGADYRVLNRFFLRHKGRTHEFDHVVIGPTGIFHVESKNWAGDIRVTDRGVERSVRGNFQNPIRQIADHHTLLQSLLHHNGIDTDVVGVLCFTNQRARVSDARRDKNRVSVGGGRVSQENGMPLLVVQLHQICDVIRVYPDANRRSHRSAKSLSRQDINRISDLITQNSRVHREDD